MFCTSSIPSCLIFSLNQKVVKVCVKTFSDGLCEAKASNTVVSDANFQFAMSVHSHVLMKHWVIARIIWLGNGKCVRAVAINKNLNAYWKIHIINLGSNLSYLASPTHKSPC